MMLHYDVATLNAGSRSRCFTIMDVHTTHLYVRPHVTTFLTSNVASFVLVDNNIYVHYEIHNYLFISRSIDPFKKKLMLILSNL